MYCKAKKKFRSNAKIFEIFHFLKFTRGTSINDVSSIVGLLDPPPSPCRPSFSPKNCWEISFLLPPPSLPLRGDVVYGWSLISDAWRTKGPHVTSNNNKAFLLPWALQVNNAWIPMEPAKLLHGLLKRVDLLHWAYLINLVKKSHPPPKFWIWDQHSDFLKKISSHSVLLGRV